MLCSLVRCWSRIICKNEFPLQQEKRKQAINTAKQQWEMMQSTLMGKSNRLTKMPEIYASHVGTYDNTPQDEEDGGSVGLDEDTGDEQSSR